MTAPSPRADPVRHRIEAEIARPIEAIGLPAHRAVIGPLMDVIVLRVHHVETAHPTVATVPQAHHAEIVPPTEVTGPPVHLAVIAQAMDAIVPLVHHVEIVLPMGATAPPAHHAVTGPRTEAIVPPAHHAEIALHSAPSVPAPRGLDHHAPDHLDLEPPRSSAPDPAKTDRRAATIPRAALSAIADFNNLLAVNRAHPMREG